MSKRKEAYVKTLENSAVSWPHEYEKERSKRIEAEAKCFRLEREIKALKSQKTPKTESMRPIKPEFGKLHKVDFGAGEIEVQHKMKDLDEYMDNLDKLDL